MKIKIGLFFIGFCLFFSLAFVAERTMSLPQVDTPPSVGGGVSIAPAASSSSSGATSENTQGNISSTAIGKSFSGQAVSLPQVNNPPPVGGGVSVAPAASSSSSGATSGSTQGKISLTTPIANSKGVSSIGPQSNSITSNKQNTPTTSSGKDSSLEDTASSAPHETIVFKGCIIDNLSAQANKDKLTDFIKTYTKQSAISPESIKSGHSILVEGNLYKFSKESTPKVVDFLKSQGNDIKVVVIVKKSDEDVELIAINNLK